MVSKPGAAPARKKIRLSTTFRCKWLDRRFTIDQCTSDWATATSMNIRHSTCYKCMQGLRNRHALASSS